MYRTYKGTLGREPDNTGYLARLKILRRGGSTPQVISQLTGSSEFSGSFQSLSADDVVRRAYQLCLKFQGKFRII